MDYAVDAITNGSHYQLWYLLFLLYSLPFVYVFLRLFSTKHQWLPILLCWIIAIFAYTYNSFIPVNILPSAELMDTFSHIPTLTSLILVGVGISQEGKRLHRAYYAIGFVISFGLLFVEAFALRHFGIKNVSYIIFTLPTAYFLFHMILECESRLNAYITKFAALLGSISTFVYCIHPMFIETIGQKINNSILSCATVILLSTATGYIFCMIKIKIREKKDNPCFS